MRTPQQMFALITGFAQKEEGVRAAFLNGSRANPAASKDALQDFDVVYAVKSTAPFIKNQAWLGGFGPIAIMQQPDDATLFAGAGDNKNRYAFLVQFRDGNRIDFSLQSVPYTQKTYFDDRPALPLLDKDGILPQNAPPLTPLHTAQPPTQSQFSACCNEFWWTSTYVAKGLWRNEVIYALAHLNECVRPALLQVLGWQAVARHGPGIALGKHYKYLHHYLPAGISQALLRSYPAGGRADVWRALEELCQLFSRCAGSVATHFGLRYNTAEEEGALHHLGFVCTLPYPGTP